ncbi:putative ferredoxin reductase [Gordonia polyisoprenivorans NBRC 16320 = JCM 10675]|uniref:FAD-dependent oxidoreductase n=1 Tax=Gordonia polyisoprenivorans TaxID=84595 RepID=A0A846WS98_9ACTN|nr:FAD-dependent oxidoreductase [Gordonia polyisoprenivorans]NKY04469.1 FAD-dependent oxidoreductase [Gordonia polyisoprenivorans]OZC29502.1 FAD-dependent oxidoreductase [Gordonia polyisoprenivorans]GAB25494.1 putative ferredoxin reductase [Gordonia polyisoprenivorans NBRC 16320 = JCM 10675]
MGVPDKVVIVGASLAGLRAAQAARADGFTGELVLIGDETHLPYDRPPLSKDFILGVEEPVTPYFDGATTLADELDIRLMLGAPADSLDSASRLVTVGDVAVDYDAILLATGSAARRLPGSEHLQGVETLRTLDDALRVGRALRSGCRTVIVGGGFIGSEVASAAAEHGAHATIVEAAETPLVRAVGATAGKWLSDLHQRHGTELLCGAGVESLVGGSRVEAVRLTDGRTLTADLVVVGIGADPNTGWLTGSGLTLDNGIVCDATMRAGESVWAAGDVARWWSEDFERSIRIEHWTNAAEQGARAMRNLLAPESPVAYRHIPYFWSDWYGSRIQLVGLPVGEPTVVTGSPTSDAFVALYRENDRLVGALALNRRGDVMKYRALIARAASWDDGLALAEVRNARTVAV